MKNTMRLSGFMVLAAAMAFTACKEDGKSILPVPFGNAGGDTVVSIAAIPGVVAPVRGEVPATTTINTSQYTGTITWSPADNPFAATTVYTANIVLTAKTGFTLEGAPADLFFVAGATATNAANSGNVTAVFPATGAMLDIDAAFVGATQTGGVSGTTDSTGLALTFDVDPLTLTAGNISVYGAAKGALTGSGTNRNLAITNLTVVNGAPVYVAISSPAGYSISGSPKTAVVYRAPVNVAFVGATQTGGVSGTADSTGLTLAFNADPVTLTADNITVTGALKGALSGSGNTRTLGISNITVTNGSTVTVTITSSTGYAITGSPQTAVVYKATIGVNFVAVAQISGVSCTADSTGLALVFDVDPTTLTASDITVTGATKGALSGTGIARILTISNITVADGATVSVTVTSPAGYSMSGSPKTEVVYRLLAIGVNYLGGKIAYILQPGDPGYNAYVPHGLIAAVSDQVSSKWGCQSTLIGGTSTALGTGMANTQAIVNGCSTASIAARICNDLVLNGYSDWYLPSLDELNKLYVNKDAIGGFNIVEYEFYWSSSEVSDYWANGLPFFNGTLYQINKDAPMRVRAVRSF